MRLPSFLQRRGAPTEDTTPAGGADTVQRARTQARQRLIGASILLGLGIIGFPLLFETQPRPVPVDIPIDIPPRDGAAPLALPARRASGAVALPATTRPAPPASPVATSPPAEPMPAPAAEPASAPKPRPVASAPAPAERPRPAASAPAPRPAASAPAARLAASAPAPKPAASAPAGEGRFVVQVGAFADAGGAREARLKAEKLGLKTYTQEAQINGATRIRVRLGPFANRAEADRALARLKAGGLPGAVLTL